MLSASGQNPCRLQQHSNIFGWKNNYIDENYEVEDLRTNVILGKTAARLKATVPGHDVLLLRFKKR
jgi:hypothetical protein